MRFVRPLLAVVLALALPALTCHANPAEAKPKPAIKRIALIPATTPPYVVESRSAVPFLFPFVGAFVSLDNRQKAQLLTEKLASPPLPLARDVSETLADALRGRGYEVEVLHDLPRVPDDPDYFDYDKVETRADAILHVMLTDVGFYSSRAGPTMVPRVNVEALLTVKGQEEYLYHEGIYYGADAEKDSPTGIPAGASFADFDAVMGKLGLVREVFQTGAREIAKRIAEQVHDVIK